MDTSSCRTHYPILLVHGVGFRDQKGFLNYWGRIPKALEDRGARIFFGSQDGWATVEQNGLVLKQRVEEVLAETDSEKIHLIAHSKGGLDTRYLVSSLGMAPKVASVTLIATPNRGSKTMDIVCRLPKWGLRLVGGCVNTWYRLLGDRNPDFCTACFQLTTAWAQEFNRQNPDADGVLYRSYAGVMGSFRSDILVWWTNLIVGWIEGENDGLVTVESAAWSGFQGVWHGVGGRGVSHIDEVDGRRRPLKYRGASYDLVEEYIKMVSELGAYDRQCLQLG